MSGAVQGFQPPPEDRRTRYERLIEWFDRLRWHFWLQYLNGADQLQRAYEAVDNTNDSLDAIADAIGALLQAGGQGVPGKPRISFQASLVWRKTVRPR